MRSELWVLAVVVMRIVSPLELGSEFSRLVPLRHSVRMPWELAKARRRQATTCEYENKTYKDGEEWDYYTSEKTESPYYGFKLKCEQGSVTVQGCYESELFVANGGREKSNVYDGYDMLCADSGFSYEASKDVDNCHGYDVGEIFDQGFYRYQCTENGLTVIACLDLDGNTHPVDDVYDVLDAYRMKCFETDQGLVVEAIACIDEDKNLIEIGKEVQSGWYRRTCQEKRDESGLQTAIALNLTMCCETTTDHCIGPGVQEPSVLFPDLTFSCIQNDEEFTYRYLGEDGEPIPPDQVPTLPNTAPTSPPPTTTPLPPTTTPLPPTTTTAGSRLPLKLQL